MLWIFSVSSHFDSSLSQTPKSTPPPAATTPTRYLPQPKTIIVFTGLEASDLTKRTIKSLSGTLSEDIKSCSHLITDKVKRTVKFLCAIGRGLPIVNETWLKQSKGCKTFVSADDFIIKDKASEKLYSFDLVKSIMSARKTAFLEGWSFHPTSACKPDANQLNDILSCNGGTLLRKAPKSFQDKLIVLANRTENIKHFQILGLPICTTELILTGVLRQRLSLEEFKL